MDKRLITLARGSGFGLEEVQRLVDSVGGDERLAGRIILLRKERPEIIGPLDDTPIFRDDTRATASKATAPTLKNLMDQALGPERV